MPEPTDGLLKVESLVTGYGRKQVLRGVSLTVGAKEIVAIIGHNGAGKSTLLKAVFGMLPIWKGRLSFNGVPVERAEPRRLLESGVAYVPQGNRVFADLSVRENLEVAATILGDKNRLRNRIDHVLALFPALSDRLRQRAGTLSGGEKQMLALACGLLTEPRLILLDEPSLGLAPPLVTHALDQVRRINQASGVAVLIVEQKVREVLHIAHRAYVLRTGAVSYSGPTDALQDPATLRQAYL